MTSFSDVLDLNRLVEQTDDYCEEHECYFVNFKHSPHKAFCPICLSEQAEKNKIEREQAIVKRYFENKPTFLEKHSIYTSRRTKKATFENYKTEDKETQENKDKALNVARKLYKGESQNVLLMGKNGTGKTHLAMAILNELNKHNKDLTCLFVSMDELFRLIKSSFNGANETYSEASMIRLMKQPDVLVVDDLGAEIGRIDDQTRASDFSYRILNAIVRGREDKSTIYTTNIEPRRMITIWDERVISPLTNNLTKIEFKTTSDKRAKADYRSV